MGGFRASCFYADFFKDKLYPVFERMNIGVGELIHSLQGKDNEKIYLGLLSLFLLFSCSEA